MKSIIFSGSMIQALLNTKPGVWPAEPIDSSKPYKWMTRRICKPQPWSGQVVVAHKNYKPRYKVGDVLWCRETWQYIEGASGSGYAYKAGGGVNNDTGEWRSPMYMPKEAARIFLLVKNVRCERLQDISEDDARAEGVVPLAFDSLGYSDAYIDLWQSINGKTFPWESNPYVFVYDIMRIEKQEEATN